MNAEMKKMRKELLHGRVQHISVRLGLGGKWTRSVCCRRWKVAPVTPADASIRWHERLAKLSKRVPVR